MVRNSPPPVALFLGKNGSTLQGGTVLAPLFSQCTAIFQNGSPWALFWLPFFSVNSNPGYIYTTLQRISLVLSTTDGILHLTVMQFSMQS